MRDVRGLVERARREAPPGDEAFRRLGDLRHRRRRNGRILSASVALAVTGAMVAGGFVVLGHRGTQTPGPAGSGSGSTAPSSGESSTQPATGRAAANLVAGPGQFSYWKFSYVLSSGHADITYWYSPGDGTGRVESSSTTPDFGGPNDENGKPLTRLQLGEFPLGDDLSSLSTDPAVLLQQLLQRNGHDGRSPQPDVTPGPGQDSSTGGLVRSIEDLLGYLAPHASPQLRAALYEVLKGLPTAQDLGPAADPVGRDAVAVRIVTEGVTRTLYFDPVNHQFMAQSLDDGSSTEFLIVDAGGIVDSDTATPDAGQEFFPPADHLPTP
jgi:hypothetical protein